MPRLIALTRAAAVAALVAGLAHGSPAAAHAIVVSSRPAVNETLSLAGGGSTAAAATAAPGLPVEIRFNSRLDKQRSRLTLVGPDGAETELGLLPDSGPELLQARVRPTQAGAYILRWRVLAVDGHITRGDIPFTVSAD